MITVRVPNVTYPSLPFPLASQQQNLHLVFTVVPDPIMRISKQVSGVVDSVLGVQFIRLTYPPQLEPNPRLKLAHRVGRGTALQRSKFVVNDSSL